MPTHTKKVELSPTSVDPVDLRILGIVRTDGRISLTSMSKKLGMSKSAVKYHLDRLIELGVIKSFFALVDSAVYGIKLSVVFDLTVEPQLIEDIAAKLSNCPEVIRAYELTNSPELHIHALFRDNEHLEHFIRKRIYSTPGVKAIKSGTIMKRYKTELTLTI